jgi:protein-L-isoaspartate(D-aspartate) O-methyltransferase
LEYLKSDKVEKIFKSIDRKDFTTTDPYEDNAQRIGFNTTISAPHMHATTLEHLV